MPVKKTTKIVSKTNSKSISKSSAKNSSKSNQIKIYSWNVNGIRAIEKKGFLDWINKCSGDIVCLQETKAQPDQITDSLKNIGSYKSYWFSAQKKGYSSVAIYSTIEPVSIVNGFNNEKFDVEGRVIFAEYEKFVLANVYFPNGGRGPERVEFKLDFYDGLFYYLNRNFKGRKGIIVTGDYNTAHQDIDLAKPDRWSKVSGYLPEERKWIDHLVNLGYTDVFRLFNKESGQYTYWDQISRSRDRNEGWRIDYFMVSNEFVPYVKDCKIYPEIMGSDHCPISVTIEV
jgi:exodeoxyribonuclease-3